MNLITYIDNRFQEVQMRNAEQNQFSILRDADANACQMIMGAIRFMLKILYAPLVLLGWVLVMLHITNAPAPKLAEAMVKAADLEKNKTKKQLRMLGMQNKAND